MVHRTGKEDQQGNGPGGDGVEQLALGVTARAMMFFLFQASRCLPMLRMRK